VAEEEAEEETFIDIIEMILIFRNNPDNLKTKVLEEEVILEEVLCIEVENSEEDMKTEVSKEEEIFKIIECFIKREAFIEEVLDMKKIKNSEVFKKEDLIQEKKEKI
jgi:hypothetical protein